MGELMLGCGGHENVIEGVSEINSNLKNKQNCSSGKECEGK
jgi:hypothetical protein